MEQIPSSPQERLRRYAREDVETLYRELRVTPAGLSREQIRQAQINGLTLAFLGEQEKAALIQRVAKG